MNNLSSALKEYIKPLKQGQIVTYRLIGAGAIDPATGKPAYPKAVSWPGVIDFFDPGDNQIKSLKNIIGSHVDKFENAKETVNRIEWNERGEIRCGVQDVNLYTMMELHPLNQDNPHRPLNKVARFYKVDPDKDARLQNELEDKMDEAKDLVRTMPESELRTYARSFPSVDHTASLEQLRYAMKQMAKANPAAFIGNCNSHLAKVKAYVSEAIEEGEIAYDAGNRSWIWGKEHRPFLTVPPGVDPDTNLHEYLVGDETGKKVLKEVKKRLMIPEAEAISIISETPSAPVQRSAPPKKAGRKPKASK